MQAVSPPRRTLDAIPSPRPAAKLKESTYVAPIAPRLVESPVFVLSSVRSGSTLLRVLLNSHSRIRAPHEMHLRTVHVQLTRSFTADAMKALELDKAELEHLLWDRVLHLELTRSGKDIIVDKTPPNTLIWPRLDRCWPSARYILLLRHPGAIVASLTDRRRDPDHEAIRAEVLNYSEKLEEARQKLGNAHIVTYEELTAEPEKATRALCDYLGVEWECGMLDYGNKDHGTFRPQLGDWSSTIKSGRIQPARTADPTAELPPRLQEIAKAWGYEVQAP
ncbi:sulfotransferase [Streptomyces sp. DG2A-72]|uniref:sulfotransferase family protein n=1 Tax=Streptomyces sp. DG2A-72 TaxID=3051386 RepID=UPI00265BE50C|nr:sulfotransferase [Streptomyces sp. DG2A-72]MDO0938060.1 sulfotransferase [Streptomyces sp. DG2A-72]